MATTIVLVALGIWVVLQTTKGPLASKLGIDATASPPAAGGSGSGSSSGGSGWNPLSGFGISVS